MTWEPSAEMALNERDRVIAAAETDAQRSLEYVQAEDALRAHWLSCKAKDNCHGWHVYLALHLCEQGVRLIVAAKDARQRAGFPPVDPVREALVGNTCRKWAGPDPDMKALLRRCGAPAVALIGYSPVCDAHAAEAAPEMVLRPLGVQHA